MQGKYSFFFQIRGEILDTKFTHSFVLTTPAELAEKLAQDIAPTLNTLKVK